MLETQVNPVPSWARRVDPKKIMRLYGSDAAGAGMLDEALLDDVWLSIYLRCNSILTATRAADGEITCPRCKQIFERSGTSNDTVLHCPGCAWRLTWGAYKKTYQGKQLHAGGAKGAFEAYVKGFEDARTPREKLLLIDRLIHAFHSELSVNISRPAAVNVIDCTKGQAIALIEHLAFGDGKVLELQINRSAWKQKVERARARWDSGPEQNLASRT